MVAITNKIRLKKQAKKRESSQDALKAHRGVYFGGMIGFVQCPIYEREKLTYGNVIEGLAIIEQYESTTVIPPDQMADIDEYGNVVI